MTGPLVDAATLRDRLSEVAVIDCRFVLGDHGAGERAYLAGHIPGAAFLDLDRDLSGPPGEGGRHPLPDLEEFAAAARRAGISAGSSVVAYDGGSDGGAARLWWLLRHFGHADVAVLDGGIGAWTGGLATGPEEIAPGDFAIGEIADDVVTRADVERIVAVAARERSVDGDAAQERSRAGATAGPRSEDDDPIADDRAAVLLDARAPERYRGDVEPVDPVAGHIPGAVNLPHQSLAPGGHLLPPEQLRERFATAGATGDTVAYCGSGVTATVLVLAAEAAGLPRPRLYPGSWSEWCR